MKFLIALLFTVNAMAGFTPFPPASPPADSITAKGNLLSHNGSDMLEFTACANDEIIVWDSAQTFGFSCQAQPSGGWVDVTTDTLDCIAMQPAHNAQFGPDISFTADGTSNYRIIFVPQVHNGTTNGGVFSHGRGMLDVFDAGSLGGSIISKLWWGYNGNLQNYIFHSHMNIDLGIPTSGAKTYSIRFSSGQSLSLNTLNCSGAGTENVDRIVQRK
jgi:hypothetical protein